MQGMRARPGASRVRSQEARQARVARARLFALLVLLGPLFGALQALAADGLPRIETEIVTRQVTIEVPVDVVVERFVDKLVYVPVPPALLHPWPRLSWDFSRWDLSRLPSPGLARVPLFRPSPIAPSVSAQAPF